MNMILVKKKKKKKEIQDQTTIQKNTPVIMRKQLIKIDPENRNICYLCRFDDEWKQVSTVGNKKIKKVYKYPPVSEDLIESLGDIIQGSILKKSFARGVKFCTKFYENSIRK